MRGAVHINLASQPFRRDRPILAAMMAASVALTALLGAQVFYAWLVHSQAADARASYESASRQLHLLSEEQSRLEAVLRRPENSVVLDYSLFLNDLVRRKAISWTRLFSDLEEVMPFNVRLVNVRPQVDANNRVQLDMTVASQAPGPVIDMLLKLEAAEAFGAPNLASSQPPTQTDPLYRYRITCNYAQKP